MSETGSRHFDQLDARAVLSTVTRLEERIRARFPERNLGAVAAELRQAVSDGIDREGARWTTRALTISSRIATVVLLILVATVVTILVRQAAQERAYLNAVEILLALESGINDVIFVAIAVVFLWLVPARLKRSGALRELYRLRSLAHVIDMHQLTKDPERLSADFQPTSKTVDDRLTAMQMANYLDYCSELLSLVGKAAALFAERTTDQSVLSTISDIEGLIGAMSNKIWQKMALLPINKPAQHNRPG